MGDAFEWYQALEKPFFAPPSWAFGLAWGIIYPLIAIALVFLLLCLVREKIPRTLFWLFVANMVANFLFSPIQFILKNNFLAMLDIFVVLITLVIFEIKVWKCSKIVFWLLMPYLLWGAFATVLQVSITILNW